MQIILSTTTIDVNKINSGLHRNSVDLIFYMTSQFGLVSRYFILDIS